MNTVLVVTAHPDDLENGIGGTLTLLARTGCRICSVVATLPQHLDDRLKRRWESRAAHYNLGTEPIFWEEPDGALEVTARLRKQMAEVYSMCKPDLVLTLWPADVHPDHRAIADIAMGPSLQRGMNTEILCFEVCSSGRDTEEFRPQSLGFFPTHYVDTSAVQVEKRKLMLCHQSQDPEGMWRGMRNVHANRAHEAAKGSAPLPNLTHAEGFVRLTRCGKMDPALSAIFKESPFEMPRGIGVDFKPKTIGIDI